MGNASEYDFDTEQNGLLRNHIKRYFDNKMQELSVEKGEQPEGVDLSRREMSRICDKLLLLPHEARYVLFGEYCFNMSFDEIYRVFSINDPQGLSVWYKRLLSRLAGLDNSQNISDASMKQICADALELYASKLEREAYQGKSQSAISVRTGKVAPFVKTIAAAAAMFIIAFVSTISVSAEFRERVVNWFIGTFSEYSRFDAISEEMVSLEDLRMYRPMYVPEDYRPDEAYEIEDGIAFDYIDGRGNLLTILITMPGEGWLIDTEGMDVSEGEYGGEVAYYYYGEDESRYIFSKDGYPMYIIGSLSYDECIRIANEIKK